MRIRSIMRFAPNIKTAARVARRIGLTTLAGASYLFVPQALGITSENFHPGLIDSLFVGAGVGFGKLTNRVGMFSLLGFFLLGPITACTIFPLSALGARLFGEKTPSAEKRINQVI